MGKKFGKDRHRLPHYKAAPVKASWVKRRGSLAIIVFLLILLAYNTRRQIPSFVANQVALKSGTSSVNGSTSAPRFAIVTFVTNEKSYMHRSLDNKYAYAKKHGYKLQVDYRVDVDVPGTMWYKFIMVERLIKEANYDWIWWIDFDTLITNGDITLEEIVQEALTNTTRPEDINLLLTADCFPLNAGSMLFRANQETLDFLNRARDYGARHKDLNEQDCVRDLVEQDQKVTDDSKGKEIGWANQHVKFIPQWKINAFPDEIKCWDDAQRGWEDGMFAVHFAGAWAHVKEEDPTGFLMKKYGQRIRNLD